MVEFTRTVIMPYTPEELDFIQNSWAGGTTEPPPDELTPKVPYKTAKQLVNIPLKTAGNLLSEGIGFLAGDEATQSDLEAAKNLVPSFEVGPAQGWADVGLDTVAPEIASWMVPYTGITKAARGLGAISKGAQVATEAVAQGAANYLSTARNDPTNVTAETSVGAVSGALQAALPRWQRLLPLAAVSGAYGVAEDSKWLGVANFIGNMLPGVAKAGVAKTADAVANTVDLSNAKMLPMEAPPSQLPGDAIQARFAAEPKDFNSQLYPGEFGFADNLQVRVPDEIPQQGSQLNRNPYQQEFNLPPVESPSGLQLNRYPSSFVDSPAAGMDEISTMGLNLVDQNGLRIEPPRVQPELDPLLTLQSQREAPKFGQDFTFRELQQGLEDTGTGELSQWRGDLVSAKPRQPLLHDQIPVSKTPQQLADELGVTYTGPGLGGTHEFKDAQGFNVTLKKDSLSLDNLRAKLAEKPIEVPRSLEEVPGAGDMHLEVLMTQGKEKAAQWLADYRAHKIFPDGPPKVEPLNATQKVEQILANDKRYISALEGNRVNFPDTAELGSKIKTVEEAEILKQKYNEIVEQERKVFNDPNLDFNSPEFAAAQKLNAPRQYINEAYWHATGEDMAGNSMVNHLLKNNPNWKPSVEASQKLSATAEDALKEAKGNKVEAAKLLDEEIQAGNVKGKTKERFQKAKEELEPTQSKLETYQEKLDDLRNNLASKGEVRKFAEKLHKEGYISDTDLNEVKRLAKDRDMTGDDLISEINLAEPKSKDTLKITKKVGHVTDIPKGEYTTLQPVLRNVATDEVYAASTHAQALNLIEEVNDTGVFEPGFLSNKGHYGTKFRDSLNNINVTGKLNTQQQARVNALNKKFIEIMDDKTVPITEQFAINDQIAAIYKEAKSKLKPLNPDEAGTVQKEMLALTAVAGVTAALAYKESRGDIGQTLAWTVLATGLGAAGIKAIKNLKGKVGEGKGLEFTKNPTATLGKKLEQLSTDTFRTPAGEAVGGRGGIWANSAHMAEALTGINAVEALKHLKIHAGGFIADQVEKLNEALGKTRALIPKLSSSFVEAEQKFLRGQLADPIVVQDIINSGGSIHPNDWVKMTAAQKAKFPEKWMVLDDPMNTNTKGPGIEVWHVTNATKQRLMEVQRSALDAAATSPTEKAYMAFPVQFRETADTLMQMVHDGLPAGSAERNRLVGTMGQYMTRSHAVITDPHAYPSQMALDNAATRLGILKENDFINANSTPTPTGMKTTPVAWRGTTVFMDGVDAANFQFLHSPESLQAEVRDYIKEIRNIAQMKGLKSMPHDSEQFMSSLFTGRKELDEVTQALLGTHAAPMEMMNNTLAKLVPAAQVSHFMQDAVKVTDKATGLKVSFNEIEFNKEIARVKQILNNPASSPGDLAVAKNQYKELQSYSRMDDNPRFGLGKDTFVSREMKRQIDSFDGTPFGFLDNSIGKGLRTFNSFFKTTHLALSPATIARQFVQAPLMMAMGGVRDANMIRTAYNGYFNRNSGFGKWMNEWGVFSSSAVHGDFHHSIDDILSGAADANIWDKIKNGAKKMHTLFSMPDDIVRASVFMNEAKRAAKELGVPLDSFDPRVARRAMEFTARRAMDYSNLPMYVKLGREIPGVNIFLAYTHEIMRISKNAAIDAANGDIQAGATLAGLATLPFIAQKMAEESLSPEDRKDWDRGQRVAQDYSRSRFKLPVSRNKDGSFNYYDVTSILPFNDFQQSARSLMRGDSKAFLATNPLIGWEKAPIFSIMAPQITGRDIHTQREFRGIQDRVRNVARQMLPGWTPGIGYEWEKSMPEAMGGTLGTTNIKTGRSNTLEGALLRNFTGIDSTQVNPDITTRNFISSAKREMANAKQYLMDKLKLSGLSKEGKQRAQEEYVEAITNIIADIQAKLKLDINQ